LFGLQDINFDEEKITTRVFSCFSTICGSICGVPIALLQSSMANNIRGTSESWQTGYEKKFIGKTIVTYDVQ
jgi:hypothetical protein